MTDFNIKESYEYKRRSAEFKLGLAVELITLICSIVAVLFTTLGRVDNDYISMPEILLIDIGVVFFFLLLLSPAALIPLFRMLYLTKHCKKFKPCTAKMTDPQLAFFTRGQLYYFDVTVEIDGERIHTSTNAIFPARDELTGNPFNNKTFACLYDGKKDKLYVLRKLDEIKG